MDVKSCVSALEEARFLTVELKLQVLSYATKDLPLMFAVSKLAVPGLIDQLNVMKNAILPNLLLQHSQVGKLFHTSNSFVFPVPDIYFFLCGQGNYVEIVI